LGRTPRCCDHSVTTTDLLLCLSSCPRHRVCSVHWRGMQAPLPLPPSDAQVGATDVGATMQQSSYERRTMQAGSTGCGRSSSCLRYAAGSPGCAGSEAAPRSRSRARCCGVACTSLRSAGRGRSCTRDLRGCACHSASGAMQHRVEHLQDAAVFGQK
jgi:hypothetical protein